MSKKIVLSLPLFLLLLASIPALAECPAPSTEGSVRICYPSNGSSIIGSTTFELSANTGSASITGVAVYDNGKKVDSLGFLPQTLVEGAIHDGYHKVTVKVWDSEGRVYGATNTFTKVGGMDPGSCAASGTGVTMCSPASGALEPNYSVPVSFALNTNNAPKSWKLYLDGKFVRQSDSSTLKNILTFASVPAGRHTMSVVAWDTAGQTYKASHTFTAFYAHDCNPDTGDCTPGIVASAPEGFGPYMAVDAQQSFQFHAEVVNNPAATQTMSVSLDGKVIAQNSGPGVSVTVNATPGTHVINVQAMDTNGKLYATYGTIYVQ